MKKFILLSIAILTFNMVSIAQTQTPEQRAKAQTEKMTTELNLSTSQVASVYEVNYGIILKNEAMRNATYTEDVKKQAIQQNNEARKSMLKSILTFDQYRLFEQKLEEKSKLKNKFVKKLKRKNKRKINQG